MLSYVSYTMVASKLSLSDKYTFCREQILSLPKVCPSSVGYFFFHWSTTSASSRRKVWRLSGEHNNRPRKYNVPLQFFFLNFFFFLPYQNLASFLFTFYLGVETLLESSAKFQQILLNLGMLGGLAGNTRACAFEIIIWLKYVLLSQCPRPTRIVITPSDAGDSDPRGDAAGTVYYYYCFSTRE